MAGVVSGSYRTEVKPSRSVGSLAPFAWRMNVRRIPSAPPNRPASKTTLSRGEASPEARSGDAPFVVQSSWAKTNAAKSTSRVSSTSRSRVETPGLNTVVHGSTLAMSWSPRVSAWSSFSCCPDDPRKMHGLFIRGSLARLGRDESLDEVERRLGDLAPAVVDGEGVTSVRDP